MTDGWYRCDRCGEFERGPIYRSSRSTGTDFAEETKRRIHYGHLKGEDDSGAVSTSVDLCHDCRKALSDWITAGADGGDPEGQR